MQPGNVYSRQASCPSDFEFSSGNKGFEGAVHFTKNDTGEMIVLALCEGNFCEGGERGRTPGNGRLVVLSKHSNVVLHGKSYPCLWQTEKVIHMPSEISFVDYSTIALRGNRVAIASQESSKVWIGHINFDTLELVTKGSKMYHFPRDDKCDVVYCSVEGLDWINDNTLVACSDRSKDDGHHERSRCSGKDQSIHVFALPE